MKHLELQMGSLLPLAVGILLSVTGGRANCVDDWLSLSPPSVAVEHGGSVSATCTFSYSETNRKLIIEDMGWEASEDGLRVENMDSLTWTVASIKDWKSKPICYVNLHIDSAYVQCQKTLAIVIYTHPKNISITSSANLANQMNEGEEHILTCTIHHIAPVQYLTVKWYRENELIKTDTFNSTQKRPVDQSSIYRFWPSREDDKATFRCEAAMNLPMREFTSIPFEKQHSIEVLYSPADIFELEDVDVMEGSSVTLRCSSRAKPHPEYEWTYVKADNVKEESDANGSLLHINNATKYNTGSYSCQASNDRGRVSKAAVVIVKGTPDRVELYAANSTGLMVDGTTYQLRCDVINISPAGLLTVRWYNGNKTIWTADKLPLTRCPPDIRNSCINTAVWTPVNRTFSRIVTLDRHQKAYQYRCEAEVDLGPDTAPLSMASPPLHVTVSYKPVIKSSEKRIPVFRGYPAELTCEADGHPTPTVQWIYSSESVVRVSGRNITVSEAGFYICNASNTVGSSFIEVEVISKEDYLPLIAGLVALVVVVISGIFIFVYSIYYKNTKMRRYSLKKPNISTSNGNVAHSVLDTEYPMTNLP